MLLILSQEVACQHRSPRPFVAKGERHGKVSALKWDKVLKANVFTMNTLPQLDRFGTHGEFPELPRL